MQTNCDICSERATFQQHLYDDRYGYPGVFDLMCCANCGHAFLRNNFTPEQLGELYSHYYPRSSFNLDQYEPHRKPSGLKAWLDGSTSAAFLWVPPDVRVLDIGCGFGQSLGYLESIGCDAYGVEADENIRRVAEKFGFKVHVGLFDPDIYEPGFFDYVTMNQVMEHVTDPVKTLQGVAQVLKRGGRAVLTMPNAHGLGAKLFGKKWINWHAPYHLQFFSRKSIAIAAKKAGLQLKNGRTLTASAWLDYQWIHLLTCPLPGCLSPFWAGWAIGKHPEVSKHTKIGVKALNLTRSLKINHLLTRLFDALDVGDSYLCILEKP